ncbi:MAG: hypothetical protein QME64_10490 [bacterium]|nr:hypothetical protein [bacterium]
MSKKYRVIITDEKLASYPKPMKVAQEQPISSGLVFKYLTFGEKAVDYSALND